MTAVIKLKRGTSTPTTSNIVNGEVAVDTSAKKLYVNDSGTIKEIGGGANLTATQLQDVQIVAGQITHVEDLGSITSTATTGTGTNIDIVADNISDVNNFADRYVITSSTPSSPSEGDLWFNTSANLLNYYSGSAWIGISGSGIASVAADASPELASTLDCNDNNLTEVGTVSGNNLQIDFGTL